MSHLKTYIFLLCVFIFTTDANSLVLQNRNISFSGRVIDTTGHILPYATLRILNTNIGTVCDNRGIFRIDLARGNYSFAFSFIGFATKRVDITLSRDTSLEISLRSVMIQMPSVIVSGENPAYPIIRRAIAQKRKMRKIIGSYKVNAYTKETFGTDSILSLISESYSELYNVNDSLKEFILKRRQSANLPEEFQLAMASNYLNFYSDSVQIWGYTFLTPLADSAFREYEYTLQHSYYSEGQKYYTIEIRPKSDLMPLFKGIIIIADSSYSLVRVSLSANEIFSLPFFDIRKIVFEEHYSLYKNKLWFPLNFHITANTKFTYMFVKIKKIITYKKNVVFFNYETAAGNSDSIKRAAPITLLPSASQYDTSSWSVPEILPLTAMEQKSYSRIAQMNQHPTLPVLITNFYKKNKDLINLTDIRYNRVDGLYLGIQPHFHINYFSGQLKIGYGGADFAWKYSLSPQVMLSKSWFIGASGFSNEMRFPFNYSVDELLNSASALLNRKDYYDYFSSEGYRLFVKCHPSDLITTYLEYSNEFHSSVYTNTRFALDSFNPYRKAFRFNPQINEGRLKSLKVLFSYSRDKDLDLFQNRTNYFDFAVEYSSPKINSDFDFLSLYSNLSFAVQTMGKSLLFNPYLLFEIQYGYSYGSLPLQRSFSFEAPLSGIIHPSVFRGVSIDQFSGDNFYSISIEHNFRNIPFIIAGIPSLTMDIILRAALGEIKTTSPLLKTSTHPTHGIYSEYSFGISRIAEFIRIDATVNNQSQFSLTTSFSF